MLRGAVGLEQGIGLGPEVDTFLEQAQIAVGGEGGSVGVTDWLCAANMTFHAIPCTLYASS
jgi:hypothetical protein